MQQGYQCPNCGNTVAYGVRFCGNCGTQMNWSMQQQYNEHPNNSQDSHKGSHPLGQLHDREAA